MDYKDYVNNVLHWNYRGFTEFPLQNLEGEESDITDIYLKENLINRIPDDIGKLCNLESLYLSGNDITELPREISKLVCLKCLDISGNRLRYIPEDIGDMRNLKVLILDENELRQLPLRIADLRRLHYLSVCDNQLEWISQRPVYNLYHCELRFWRNPSLQMLPYSLWYHMFRGEQTLSLNIGSLFVSKHTPRSRNTKYSLKLKQDNKEYDIETHVPSHYKTILGSDTNICPSLLELCKRKLYGMISFTATKLSDETFSFYSDFKFNGNHKNNGTELQKTLERSGINKINEKQTLSNKFQDRLQNTSSRKEYYVPSDIVNGYFYYLPHFIKNDLCNGPVSRCENILCRIPIFDYALYDFCLEKISSISGTTDVILSATFCSKSCREVWKTGKNILQSVFVQ